MPSSRARRAVALSASLLALSATPALADTGVDVSQYQHPGAAAVSFPALKQGGTSFVFVKATEGPGWANPWLRGDWAASSAAGLAHGAYHFARPSRRRGSAVAQARWFVRVAGTMRQPGELPPVLDIESTGGLRPRALIGWVGTWLRTVQRLTGRRPIVYSYPGFWRRAMAGTRAFRNYPLWGACYCGAPTTFGGAWRSWTFWQFSDRGHVPGVPTLVDVNRFAGSSAELTALANGSVPAPAPAPVTPPAPAPTDPTAPPSTGVPGGPVDGGTSPAPAPTAPATPGTTTPGGTTPGSTVPGSAAPGSTPPAAPAGPIGGGQPSSDLRLG